MSAAMRDIVLRIVERNWMMDEWLRPTGGGFSLNLLIPHYDKLVIEKMYMADHGRVCCSVGHTYVQNGDVMYDPEMVFDLSDWKPLYFKNTGLGVEQYVFVTPERKQWHPRLQRDLTSFARTWAKNLHDQGFDNPEKTHVTD